MASARAPNTPGAITQSRGDDVSVGIRRFNVAVQDLCEFVADEREELCLLHDAAAQDHTVR